MKKKTLLLVLLSLTLVGCGNVKGDNGNEVPGLEPEVSVTPDDDKVHADGENLAATTKLRLHYARNSGDFTNWGAWVWQMKPTSTNGKMFMFTQNDGGVYGNYTDIDLAAESHLTGATEIGFLLKTHTGTNMTQWTDGLRDVGMDRTIVLPEQSPNGMHEVWLYEGVETVMTSLAEALKDKIVSSDFSDKKTINTQLILSADVEAITEDMFEVYADGVKIPVASFKYADKKVTVTLPEDADITKTYSIKVLFPSGEQSLGCGISVFYDDPDFINNYTYYGDDLGVTFNKERTETTFKLWAPISSNVVLNLYDSGTSSSYSEYAGKLSWQEFLQDFPTRKLQMNKGQQGVWSITVPGNLHGRYYTYSVTNGAMTNEVVDPYARTTGIDGNRGQVVDFDQINEEVGWDSVEYTHNIENQTDAIIYEVHVRDVTIDPSSGVSEANRGNFLGLAEKGTYYEENGKRVSTGLDSIKELGVTHLQLQPIYDYNSVDEAAEKKYNWGYDPENYNALEGSYSTNPYDGLVRVKEFKQLMKVLSAENLAVNMDVVYNHTAGSSDTNFEMIIPGYYHRMNADGTFSNGSGCGNEMASERYMYRKFVVDSCKYWVDEFKVSGFRFDLMALLDTTTMETVYKECKKIYDKVMVYGEPWAGGSSLGTYEQSTQETIQGIEGVGAFNDKIRNAIRGGNNKGDAGWVQNPTTPIDQIVQGIWGQFTSSLTNPSKTVNYVSCHDNYALYDQINYSMTGASEARKADAVEQAQAMVFFAEGIPFMHGGEEFLRTKSAGTEQEVHNSYNAGDHVNRFDYSLKVKNIDTYNFMKDAIATRNEFKGFRMPSFEQVSGVLKFNTPSADAWTSTSSVIDYEVTYGGKTYRVITNAGSATSVSGLAGYTVRVSNNGAKLTNNSISVPQNGIVVLVK